MRILAVVLVLFFTLGLNAQSWVKLKNTNDVKVFYKIKSSKDGKEELRVKFINQAKSDLNVDLEVGFYNTGVLEQRSMINRCLKKGFHSNLFRMWQIIELENNAEKSKISSYELKVLDLKTKKVDKCEVMEP